MIEKLTKTWTMCCFAAGLGIRVAIKPEYRITPPVRFVITDSSSPYLIWTCLMSHNSIHLSVAIDRLMIMKYLKNPVTKQNVGKFYKSYLDVLLLKFITLHWQLLCPLPLVLFHPTIPVPMPSNHHNPLFSVEHIIAVRYPSVCLILMLYLPFSYVSLFLL